MSEAEQRAAVVAEARRWIGTPYHHAADIRGAGCDCAMLLLRVFAACGLLVPFEPRPYPRDWHLHRGEERYLAIVAKHAVAIEAPQPGDVVLFRHGRSFSHGGIVSDLAPLRLVHASWPARMVIEETLAGSPFAGKAQRCFNPWGVGI